MAVELQAITNETGTFEFRLIRPGAFVIVEPATAPSAANPFHYIATVGASMADGRYASVLVDTSDNRAVAVSDIVVRDNEVIDIDDVTVDTTGLATTTDVTDARDNINSVVNERGGTTDAAVAAARDSVQADIAALVIPTVAEIEAALLDDADGSAVLAAISSAVEASLGDDTDGDAFLAAVQAACAAAITSKALATSAQVTSLDLLTKPDVAAVIAEEEVALRIDVQAGFIELVDKVDNLNDLSATDVTTAVDLSALATSAQLIAARDNVNAATSLGFGEIEVGVDDIEQAVSSIGTNLVRVLDIALADEEYNTGAGTARKLHRETGEVLVDKVLATDSPIAVLTTLTEAEGA